MSQKHKNVSPILNYIDHFLIFTSTNTGCILISAFSSLIGIPLGITSSTAGFKICASAAGIRKHKPIMKKNKNKHDKIVLLAKSKLNSIELLISKALMNSNISHDEFVLINNVLKEYYDMIEATKNLNT